jgi:hypothetical protein
MTPYAELFVHNGLVYEFLQVLKNQNFAQNPYVLAFGFTKNHQFVTKTDRNFVFLSADPHIPDRL